MHHDQDVVNPRTQSDVFLLPPIETENDEHPYQYGHVDAIFHVVVQHIGRGSKTEQQQIFNVCWLKRYGLDSRVKGGFKEKRMHCVGPAPDDYRWSYIFVDPKHIVCTAHLIPAFAKGENLDNNQIGTGEYNAYYVNPYVFNFCLHTIKELYTGFQIVICWWDF